jgi:DNA-binding XRE family transcriptional regulator
MERREALTQARINLGLSQRAFAAKLGVHRSTVLNIEVGRRDPSYELMLRWTDALGPHGHFDLWEGTKVHSLRKDILARERDRERVRAA